MPWAAYAARHAYDFPNQWRVRCKGNDSTRVAKDVRVNGQAVGHTIVRGVDRLRAAGDELCQGPWDIGLDELLSRKGDKYTSIVMNRDRRGTIVTVASTD